MTGFRSKEPEKLLADGIYVYKQKRVHVGDAVEAIREVAGLISGGTKVRIAKITMEPRDEFGFEKRLLFSEFPDEEFNPKRFRKLGIADEQLSACVVEALTPQAVISHQQHNCPDLSPILPTIAAAVVALTKNHPLLKIENEYRDEPYYAFQRELAGVLQTSIDDGLFSGYRGQKRFLIHMWTGLLAHLIWRCALV